ncbi:MAG TPA: hypothetical protein VMB50_18880 [Myxococcales bacterium]|jgi:hypothetical protein|nr:hypothetical protein [Myxococcales bacterium]
MAPLLVAAALCLICLPIEAALLPFLGLSTARADLALCAVLWLAVAQDGVVEGAVGAYVCGTVADLLYAVHPGLFALLALLLYTLVRVFAGALDVRGPWGFSALCGLGALLQSGLARLLFSVSGQTWPAGALPGILGGAALTAACGAPVWMALSWSTRALTREDPSLLR